VQSLLLTENEEFSLRNRHTSPFNLSGMWKGTFDADDIPAWNFNFELQQTGDLLIGNGMMNQEDFFMLKVK
jgi:hypothetical protein